MDTNRERRIFVIDDEQPPNDRGIVHTHQDPSSMYNGLGVKRVGPQQRSRSHPRDENDPPPLNLRSLAASFFKKSSIYALNQIGNSKTLRRKIFWSFILIGGLIGCCSQVYRYLSAYYEYPVVINIDSINLFNQQFPGVTICNLNNIRKSFFKCLLDKADHQTCREQSTEDDSGGPEELDKAVGWNDRNCFTKRDAQELSHEFLNHMKFISLFYSLDESSRRAYGHQVSDLIKSCTFNGEECFHDHFTLHQDPVYGNCFTFNRAGEGKPSLTTSFVGPNSGLTLELNVQSQEYSWMTQSVGARVVIHDPHQEPTPQDQGVNVSPGFETTIGLSKVVMQRLPYPYKDQCKAYGVGDSKRLCDSACFERKISSFCSCSMPSAKLEAKRYCDMTDVDALCCIYQGQMEDDLGGPNATCHCPLECVSSDYEMKLSSGVWPARSDNLGEDYKSDKLEDVRETWVKLKVYYDNLEQLTYEQKPMFEDSEVLSQIGGQMGLWLGLSLAAMFECLENMVLLWHYRSKKT